MNLKQFKYVLALAQEGSFSKAAYALSISQPSLSQYIKKIEQEIGSELFIRTGGYVRLTDVGKVYIDAGQKMLNLERQLVSKINDISSCKAGSITIGISAHRGASLMPEVVRKFREKYPNIVLCIEEMKRGEIIEAAEHGAFDLCITTLPIDEKHFDYEIILVEENVIAVPSSICIESEIINDRIFPAISVKDLDGLMFAMLNEEHPMQRELSKLCEKYNLNLRKTVECTSLETLLEMVKNGIGVAFIPACMSNPHDSIRYFSIKEITKKREIVLIYRKNQYLSKAINDLTNIMKMSFKNKMNSKETITNTAMNIKRKRGINE